MAKDFTKKTFGKTLRGYVPEEVDEYLAYVNDEYKKIEHRAQDFERKLILALKKIDELMGADEAEKEAAVEKRAEADEIFKKAQAEARAVVADAETAAVKIREAAAAEAEARLNEAEAAAKNILEAADAEMKKARGQAAAIHDAVSEMYDEARSFKDALFSLYTDHIASMESIEETAEKYINGVDGIYSDATGETVNRDDGYEEDEEDEIPDEAEKENIPHLPAGDIIIDIADEADEYEEFIQMPEIPADNGGDDAETAVIDRMNPKNSVFDDDDKAATRVLRLSALSEAIVNLGEDTDEDDTDEFADDYDDSEDGSEEEDTDFTPVSFGAMDSLFTSKNSDEYSEKDEFDIVFAEADSRRNVEEIRRQPIVPAGEPQKTKKHKKF